MEKKRNIDKFKGYPHYPDNEDITRAKNNNGRITTNREGLDAARPQPQDVTNDAIDPTDGEVALVPGTDADLTPDEIRMLQAADQNMDTPDDVNLQQSTLDSTDSDGDLLNEESSLNIDMTGEDLDVPGSHADDRDEDIGEEDEENNYYSLGGDNHESQEENKGA